MRHSKWLLLSFVLVAALSLVVVAPIAAKSPATAPPCTGTIVQIALCVNGQSGEFDTLIAALSSAGLVNALNGQGQFTVFAPTDEAFAKLGLTAANIGNLDTATLSNILLYHVASGERFAKDFRRRQSVKMLNGDKIQVYRTYRTIVIRHEGGTSRVVAGDIDATNGVIHVINRVLLPDDDTDDKDND